MEISRGIRCYQTQLTSETDFLEAKLLSITTTNLLYTPSSLVLPPLLEVGSFHLTTVNPETLRHLAIFIASVVMSSFILLRIKESDNLPLELVPVFLRSMVGLSPRCVYGLTISIGDAVIDEDFANALCEVQAMQLRIKGPQTKSLMQHLEGKYYLGKIIYLGHGPLPDTLTESPTAKPTKPGTGCSMFNRKNRKCKHNRFCSNVHFTDDKTIL